LPATANVRVYPLGTGISANKFFEPAIINAGENSRLRVNLRAPDDTGLTNFTLIDTLPAGVTVSNSTAPFVSPNCGPTATLTAVTGSNTITLSNASINAGIVCRIDVWVTSSTPGTCRHRLPDRCVGDQ